MSRHRDVRNLNIADELDDDALSDGGGDELTPEQQAQMTDGMEQVRLVVGNEDVSGLSDNSIKDALWEYYFDVEKTVTWAFEERERRQIAKEKKEHTDEEHQENTSNENYQGSSYQYYQTIQIDSAEDDEVAQHTGPRLPSIFRAQQQPGFDNAAYLEPPADAGPMRKKLSTISEGSERTEPSTLWRPGQHYLAPNTPRTFVPSVTTSYVLQIGDEVPPYEDDDCIDPNISRTTPSGSAIQQLSTYNPPPSNSSHGSHSDHYIASTDPVSLLKDLPSIPDLESKSSRQAMQSSPPPLPVFVNKSQSKLSKLATSKASSGSVSARSQSTRSESSKSSGTAVTGSIKTYPALRPSAQSERPPSVGSSKDLPDIPPEKTSTTGSATSSIVRRAIEAAMEFDNMESVPSLQRPQPEVPVPSHKSDHSTPPNIEVQQPSLPNSTVKPASSSEAKPMSKLALLAQQKAEKASRYIPSPEPSSISTARPLSKLAMLAQQKVDATRVPKLPKTTTEYLTPIANGSSVTTAITTSYQSLYSLTDPSRTNVIPKLDVVPLQAISPVYTDHKASKLALKVKRASEKAAQIPTDSQKDDAALPISPIFQPKPTHAHRNKGKDTKHSKRERSRHKHDNAEADKHIRKAPAKNGKNPDSVVPNVFAFDGPSPDDVVLNARKRSALGSKASSKLSLRIEKTQSST